MTDEELQELLKEYQEHLVCGDDEKSSYFAAYIPELVNIILKERHQIHKPTFYM